MNRLIQRFNMYQPGCFRLVIGLTSDDPATPEEKKWTTPISPNDGSIPSDVKVLHFLDFVYGHHAIEPTPDWKYWMRYGWVQHPEEPSGHQRLFVEPFVNLTFEYTEDEIKGFLMQCLVRRQKVYPSEVDRFGYRQVVEPERHEHTIEDILHHNPHKVSKEQVGLGPDNVYEGDFIEGEFSRVDDPEPPQLPDHSKE